MKNIIFFGFFFLTLSLNAKTQFLHSSCQINKFKLGKTSHSSLLFQDVLDQNKSTFITELEKKGYYFEPELRDGLGLKFSFKAFEDESCQSCDKDVLAKLKKVFIELSQSFEKSSRMSVSLMGRDGFHLKISLEMYSRPSSVNNVQNMLNAVILELPDCYRI